MNRLLKKIREFGLIFHIDSDDPDYIVKTCKALKKAHVPLVLFPFDSREPIDRVKLSNDSEDMFIGALCSCSAREIQKAFASGCHFAFSKTDKKDEYEKALSLGLDLYALADSQEDLTQIRDLNPEALFYRDEASLREQINPESPFFLQQQPDSPLIERWRTEPNFVASIVKLDPALTSVEEIYGYATELLRRFLGIEFLSLTLKEGSERHSEGQMLTALSGIPLYENGTRDLLEIGVRDLERTVAHLKWHNIFMDPLSAQMSGDRILNTELYDTFLGWPVKLKEL